MFLTGERSNHNFPDFLKHHVSKCTTNIYGRSGRNVVNHHFSANGISPSLGIDEEP